MLRPQLRSADLVIEFRAGRIPPVRCAPQELRQVFLNLVVNAIDAVKGHGRVSIATSCDGEEVVVEVRDDGSGIPPDTLERIFDPFFTTKKVGEGTGLGLAIAWHIVDAHGGHVEVTSPPGEGARFRVCLPIGDPGRADAAEPADAGSR
jgi:signal transduction histidine kinase